MSSLGREVRPAETETRSPRYQDLGSILGYALVWDHEAHQPWWPEGEPKQVSYDADDGVTINAVCDVNQAWWHGRGKPLDCGHRVAAPGHYVSWLAEQRDECLACAGARP